eukprot:EG_transcript_21742
MPMPSWEGPPVESSPSPTTSWSLATILVGVPLLASVLAIVARGSHRPPTLQWATMATSVEAVDSGEDQAAQTLQMQKIRGDRIAKMTALEEAGLSPFAYSYAPTHTTAAVVQGWAHLEAGQEDPEATVDVAGRVMARRVFGKLAFFTLRDAAGDVQLYIEKARMDPESFDALKKFVDVGDIIGAKGTVKRTEKGELSVCVTRWTMLTKSLRPLPDKWGGLKDKEKRYRQREVDLIVSPEVRQAFRLRARIT